MSQEKVKQIKITEKEIKGKKGDKEIPVKIRTKGGDKELDVKFEKLDKGTKSKEEVAFEYKIKADDKWPETWTEFKSKVEWTGGWVANGMKLDATKVGDVELKEEVNAPMGFFGTPTIPCWIGIVIILVALIAGIWWWIASSNKEDKEEESL